MKSISNCNRVNQNDKASSLARYLAEDYPSLTIFISEHNKHHRGINGCRSVRHYTAEKEKEDTITTDSEEQASTMDAVHDMRSTVLMSCRR